jgi:hypothetical protein
MHRLSATAVPDCASDEPNAANTILGTPISATRYTYSSGWHTGRRSGWSVVTTK